MESKLKCPFCNSELVGTIGHPICRNQDCVMCDDSMPQDLLEELIRTRKALDVAKDTIRHTDWFFDGDLTIEQCTGLKDKDGNLIYEGDCVGFYVYEQDGNWYGGKGVVVWRNSSWGIETSSHFICFENNIPMANPQGIEIIGNVHKQSEQKDEK